MDHQRAAELLGVAPGEDPVRIRRAWRRRMRTVHPDTTGADGSEAAELNEALRCLLAGHGSPTRPDGDSRIPANASTDRGVPSDDVAPSDADATLRIDDVGPDAFALLAERASQVGDVAYIDRQLELLEIVVRFVGGPSCSVVMTTQGRIDHTEVFVTMESIEAAPTPPIGPVLAALHEALAPSDAAPH